MKLGFDIDGIVANIAQAMVNHINEKYGFNYGVEIFKEHSVCENKYVDDPEKNEAIAFSVRKNIIYNDDAIITIKPHNDGVEAIRKLVKAGHSIHFITYRPLLQKEATIDWFRQHKIPFDTIDVLGKSSLDDGGFKKDRNKGSTARALNLDFYLDDYPENLYEMYLYKNRWYKGMALFTRPWNANTPLDMSKFLKFDNWKEIIRHLGIHKR